MRSCTGWPSGIWIDEPRRTAPDGSNFQLQHWTHVFDYALVCGAGDWRHAEIPARSADFSHPLLAVTASGRVGGLPADRFAAAGRPGRRGAAGCAQGGRQPAGARQRATPSTPAGWPSGWSKPAAATPTSPCARRWARCPSCEPADLLERPRVGAHLTDAARLPDRHRAGAPRPAHGCSTARTPRWPRTPRTCQPLYARYWLHNRGPAPLGGLPAVAHLHPHRLTAAAGADVVLRLTAASDSCDASLAGTVTAGVPARLVGQPGRAAVHAAGRRTPGGRRGADDARCTSIPAAIRCGRSCRSPASDVPPAWRQVVEDVCMISVGGADDGGLVYLVDGPADVEVAAGESARLAVTVGTDACADLSLEAHLISPWGTWEWIGPATLGAVLPARGTVELGFDVSPPAWVRARPVVGPDPGRLRRPAGVLAGGESDRSDDSRRQLTASRCRSTRSTRARRGCATARWRLRCRQPAPARAGSCVAG